jgi:YVTN family beta-propeller protein
MFVQLPFEVVKSRSSSRPEIISFDRFPKDAIIEGIEVGKKPIGITIDPQKNVAYVVNRDSNTVSVIDGRTLSINSTVASGVRPWDIALNPNTEKVYIANRETDSVSIIDGKTYRIVGSIKVDDDPLSVALDHNTNKVYVSNIGSRSVSVIDGRTNSIIMTIPLDGDPTDVAVNTKTKRVYVGVENRASGLDAVIVIDGQRDVILDNPIILGRNRQPNDVVVNSNTNMVYVPNYEHDTVTVINGKTNDIVKEIPVGETPVAV